MKIKVKYKINMSRVYLFCSFPLIIQYNKHVRLFVTWRKSHLPCHGK